MTLTELKATLFADADFSRRAQEAPERVSELLDLIDMAYKIGHKQGKKEGVIETIEFVLTGRLD